MMEVKTNLSLLEAGRVGARRSEEHVQQKVVDRIMVYWTACTVEESVEEERKGKSTRLRTTDLLGPWGAW